MNVYWPVYKNLEDELESLSYSIHIADEQLDVYSNQIAALILRAVSEIESISKDIYRTAIGDQSKNVKFDEVAIKYFVNEWALDQKEVVLAASNCFQTNRIFLPFIKDEPRTGAVKPRKTFSWNNAYQNLKHDRAQNLSFGSLKYLFDSMAALYLLNIYYKNEEFECSSDANRILFPNNLGSSFFSLDRASSSMPKVNATDPTIYKSEANKCTYLHEMTHDSAVAFDQWNKAANQKFIASVFKNPKFAKYLTENPDFQMDSESHAKIMKIIGKQEYINLYSLASQRIPNAVMKSILNKQKW